MATDKQIRVVMTKNPVAVSEKDTIREVARIMKREDTGVVPVIDAGKKVIGMVTDRDIVVRLVAEGKDPSNAKVNEVMTKNVRAVREEATVKEALDVMSDAQVRRVPVVNTKNELVGIVSIGDIATDSNQANVVGKTVEEISQAPPNGWRVAGSIQRSCPPATRQKPPACKLTRCANASRFFFLLSSSPFPSLHNMPSLSTRMRTRRPNTWRSRSTSAHGTSAGISTIRE